MKKYKIRTAAVLGAGVMGSKIAALLAGADIQTRLMDMVPGQPDAMDIKKGLNQESPDFRNKLAMNGINSTLMASPPAIFAPEDAKYIVPGNFEDHLDWLGNVDWIIEAVAEDLVIKKALLARVESVIKPGTIVSTNTSGVSIQRICEDLSENTRRHFLGTHFFNPPRHMKLLEIVPGKDTDMEVVSFMADFCENRLGKSVVFAKDTPNFIANRIGAHALIAVMKAMVSGGYTVEEVDAITGPPMGRPRSASFRTADMVGLDTIVRVADNVAGAVVRETEKEAFTLPDFVGRMVENGLLGEKAQKGFYKKVVDAQGSQIYALDYRSMEYVPQRKPDLALLDEVKVVDDLAARLPAIVYATDRAGSFAWNTLKRMLLYCAECGPEIADNPAGIDQAMRWGFNWDMGPFEIWDAIGLRKSVQRMAAEGESIPESISSMLAQGKETFYQRNKDGRSFYDFTRATPTAIAEKPQILVLPSLKDRQKTVLSNHGASLVDLGDGVACFEIHTSNNAIDGDVIQMLNDSLSEVEDNFEGMVIGNQGTNFCVGADVKQINMLAENRDWDNLEMAVREFQQACMNIKYSEKPVVAAPFRMTLGGGCELCLAAGKIRGFAESYMGLVEMGVGLIPGGGGNKEMLLRAIDWVPESVPSAVPGGGKPDLVPYVARIFEMIATAKVSTSAKEARKLGFLNPGDNISMNYDFLLHDAKQCVLNMVREGYRPPRPRDDIRIVGRTGRAILELMVFLMLDAGYITPADAHIAKRLAYVLTGGDLDQNTLVTEQYLLDLEREVFLSLAGEEKTRARLKSMAETNKPLHN